MARKLAAGLAVLGVLVGAPAGAVARWTRTEVPGADAALAVSCPSSSQCMAVGGQTAERWDGASWSGVQGPEPFDRPTAIWCAATGSCVAVGYQFSQSVSEYTLAELWNGANWTVESTPNPGGGQSELRAVSCVSSSSCMAVGDYVDSREATLTLAEHWDGSRWTVQPTPNPSRTEPQATQAQHLSGVSCSSATLCVAVGNSVISVGNNESVTGTLVERWNGVRWSVQKSPNPPGSTSSYLRSVSCTSSAACTAIGNYYVRAQGGHQRTMGLIERWRHHHWSIQKVAPVGTGNTFLSSVSCASLWACTAVGSHEITDGGHAALAERWNGRRWILTYPSLPAGASTSELGGVSCPLPGACIAAGGWGLSNPNRGMLGEQWSQ